MNGSPLMLVLLVGISCGAAETASPDAEMGLPREELPGEELLEFLGGWEGENDEWQEFFDSLPAIRETASPEYGADERNEQIDQENRR